MWAWLIHLIVSIQTSKVRLANNVKLFKGAKGAYPCNWTERSCPIKNSPIDAVFEISVLPFSILNISTQFGLL